MGMKGFVEGGIAAVVAGSSTHPLDLIKVRMQLQGETTLMALPPSVPKPGPIAVGAHILRSEGPLGLFSGVSATVLRQAIYSTTRMGLYDYFKKKWSPHGDGASLPVHLKIAAGFVSGGIGAAVGSMGLYDYFKKKWSPHGDGASLPVHLKIAAGFVSGGIGAAVGNPADVAMVRMQADGRLPITERRNYKSVADAINRMVRQEGIGSLWRGSSLTINRAMIVTASQLATYDQAKEAILGWRGKEADGLGTHVVASFTAGLVAAGASNPVDVVKTRIMNMKVEHGKPLAYTGAIDCLVKTVSKEGVMALYKGFIPTVTRQGPFTVVLFVTLEQVKKVLAGVDF